ncbi:MAG: hypothetical protein QF542_04180 [Alphaproteobacteria bacterium]|nr:hypothetical protein [Alphaproteobacteria bacterium]
MSRPWQVRGGGSGEAKPKQDDGLLEPDWVRDDGDEDNDETASEQTLPDSDWMVKGPQQEEPNDGEGETENLERFQSGMGPTFKAQPE